MPAPLINKYKENKIANNHAILTGNPSNSPYDQLAAGSFQNRAQQRAMEVLNGYNPFGNGTCPSIDFTIPGGPYSGFKINYIFGNSELSFNGNPYSSLPADEKKIIYFWIPNVIREAIKNYDKTYNI